MTGGTTKLELTLIRETDKARYYENARGKRQWVPRSVCPRTLKIGKTHEVQIEDWVAGKPVRGEGAGAAGTALTHL